MVTRIKGLNIKFTFLLDIYAYQMLNNLTQYTVKCLDKGRAMVIKLVEKLIHIRH